MHFTTPLLLALAASTSAYTSAVQKCATPPPTSEFLAVHADHAQQAAASPGLVARQEKPFVNFTLNVYAHVIESDISDANIASQVIYIYTHMHNFLSRLDRCSEQCFQHFRTHFQARQHDSHVKSPLG